MRIFTVFLFLLIGIVIGSLFFPRRQNLEKITTITDTVSDTRYDTVRYGYPVAFYWSYRDTLFVHDTILIREEKVYKDSTYTAWVSGYQTNLDSIEVYPRTVTNYITKTVTKTKKPKWVISVGGGIGYNGKIEPYVGLNAGYVIWSK